MRNIRMVLGKNQEIFKKLRQAELQMTTGKKLVLQESL